MPTIQNTTVVPGASSNPNLAQGSAYEFAPFHARVDIGVVGDAGGFLRATVQAGSDVLLEESPLSQQNRFPVWPDDFTMSDVVAKGDRIKIVARNTDVAANPHTVFWAIRLTPLV